LGAYGQDGNSFYLAIAFSNDEKGLVGGVFKIGAEFEVMPVPNIVNIIYGRRVGSSFEEELFNEILVWTSATKVGNI